MLSPPPEVADSVRVYQTLKRESGVGKYRCKYYSYNQQSTLNIPNTKNHKLQTTPYFHPEIKEYRRKPIRPVTQCCKCARGAECKCAESPEVHYLLDKHFEYYLVAAHGTIKHHIAPEIESASRKR